MAAKKSEGPDHRDEGISVRRYALPGGWEVIAGKSDVDNDAVSLRLAAQNDWWFHAHATEGSHVILRAREGEEPSKDVILQAAAIAAYHSKARAAGQVPVVCTRAGNVSKPRGAKPGTVSVRREKIVKVRPGLPGDAAGLSPPERGE